MIDSCKNLANILNAFSMHSQYKSILFVTTREKTAVKARKPPSSQRERKKQIPLKEIFPA
jgi:hypothetical protein